MSANAWPPLADESESPPPFPEPLLKTSEVARFLGVHPNYIYDLVARGDLTSYKIGGVRRFRRSDVEQWLEAHRQCGPMTGLGFLAGVA